MLGVPTPLAAAACFSRLGALRLHRLGPPGTPSTTRVMICPRSRWCSVLGPHVLPFTPSAGTTNTRIIKSSSSYQKPTDFCPCISPVTSTNAHFLQNSSVITQPSPKSNFFWVLSLNMKFIVIESYLHSVINRSSLKRNVNKRNKNCLHKKCHATKQDTHFSTMLFL